MGEGLYSRKSAFCMSSRECLHESCTILLILVCHRLECLLLKGWTLKISIFSSFVLKAMNEVLWWSRC